MKKETLKEYAKLIVHKGINVQKGEKYLLDCPVEQYIFANLIVEELYKSGASNVYINYIDSSIRSEYKYLSKNDLLYFPPYKINMYKTFLKEARGRIVLSSPKPSLMKDIDIELITKINKRNSKKMDFFYTPYGDNKLKWCIAAVPNKDWAKKVFPNLSPSKAIDSLWNAIFNSVSVKGDKTSLITWSKHNNNLKKRAEILNNMNLISLHFTSSNGTDLNIGLVDDYIFEGGTSFTPEGIEFDANMPTEEIFTMPHKEKINGTVYSTKPLFIYGEIIENFGLVFKDGNVSEILCDNKKHKQILKSLISADKGASSLGEVALVPYSSPINKTGILFFNTLFDENASCHIALGDSYKTNMKNSELYTEEEMKQKGSNTSIIHVDFMIGNESTKVEGLTKDNKTIIIMDNGEFVI